MASHDALHPQLTNLAVAHRRSVLCTSFSRNLCGVFVRQPYWHLQESLVPTTKTCSISSTRTYTNLTCKLVESQLPIIVILVISFRVFCLSLLATVNTHSRRQEFFRRHEENRPIDSTVLDCAGTALERSTQLLLLLRTLAVVLIRVTPYNIQYVDMYLVDTE